MYNTASYICMAKGIYLASCSAHSCHYIAILQACMQINRNPCIHVASNIKTCITIYKKTYSYIAALKNHACMYPAGKSSNKVLLQVTILMFHRLQLSYICSSEMFSRSLTASCICSKSKITTHAKRCNSHHRESRRVATRALTVSSSLRKWLQYNL